MIHNPCIFIIDILCMSVCLRRGRGGGRRRYRGDAVQASSTEELKDLRSSPSSSIGIDNISNFLCSFSTHKGTLAW